MGKVFKTALFGGFKKKEVIQYLDGVSREKKLEKELNDEQVVKLEQTAFELKNKLAEAELSRDRLESELVALRNESEPVRLKNEELETERLSLSGELSRLRTRFRELEQHNSALSSSVLDFEDERRAMQANVEELKAEHEERRRELESRIFDLEAEIIEGLEEQRPSQPGGAERAYRGAREVSRSIADVGGEDGRRVLEDLKTQLEDIIAEINRLIRTQDAEKPEREQPVAAASTAAAPARGRREKHADSRLSSLGDILRHVKAGRPD